MEYKRTGDMIFLRLQKGEEIVESLKEIATKENSRAASVSGIGATDDFTVGVYKTAEKQYCSKEQTRMSFSGPQRPGMIRWIIFGRAAAPSKREAIAKNLPCRTTSCYWERITREILHARFASFRMTVLLSSF